MRYQIFALLLLAAGGCSIFGPDDPDDVAFRVSGVGTPVHRYVINSDGVVGLALVGSSLPYELTAPDTAGGPFGFALRAVCPSGDCSGEAEVLIRGRRAYRASTRESIIDPLNHLDAYVIGAAARIGQPRPVMVAHVENLARLSGQITMRTPDEEQSDDLAAGMLDAAASPGDTVVAVLEVGTGAETECLTATLGIRVGADDVLPLAGGTFCARASLSGYELRAVVPE